MMDYNEDLYSFDEKPKRKRDEDPTTWTDAFKALAIFLAAVLIFGVVGNILYYAFMGDKAEAYYKILATTSESNTYISSMYGFNNNPIYIIFSIILSMVLSVIGLFIIYGLIHVFATKLFKGEGTLRGLIVRANIWTTGTYVAVLIASSIQSIIMMNSIVANFEGINIGTSYSALQAYNETVLGLLTPLYLIYGIAWLAWSIAVSRIVGRNYAIGDGKGCASLIVMNVSLFTVVCACSFAIGAVAYNLIASSL